MKNKKLQPEAIRYAFRLTIGCLLVLICCEYLHSKNGYWALYSVITCVWPLQSISIKRVKHRTFGTFAGMWLGIFFAHLLTKHIFFIDLVVAFCVFMAIYLKMFGYGYYVTFVTTVTVLLICLLSPGDWYVAITRFEMTLLGTAIALLVNLMILPTTVNQQLAEQLTQLKSSLQEYYQDLCTLSLHKESAIRKKQQNAFKVLQLTLQRLKESANEFNIPIDFNITLEKVYQTLLVLEIFMPVQLQHQELKALDQNLQLILKQVCPLFIEVNFEKTESLQTELIELQKKLKQQRSIAAANLDIPSTTLYEHIELSLLLQTLQDLLLNLKTFAFSIENQILKIAPKKSTHNQH